MSLVKKNIDGTYTYKYPHPAVTTDCVVFGFDGRTLNVLLIERGLHPYKGMWALPGGFVRMDETVEQGAARELLEEAGISDIYLQQFHVFSAVNRDPRERVITVAFLALVRKGDFQLIAGDDAARASWFEYNELPPLAFDHDEIIQMARERLKVLIQTEPIAFNLLDKHFSMPDLQRIYELINNTTYDRRNFAKKINASGYVHRVEEEPEEDDFCAFDGGRIDFEPDFMCDLNSSMRLVDCYMPPEPQGISHACSAPKSESGFFRKLRAIYEAESKGKPQEPPKESSRAAGPNLYSFDSEKFESDRKKDDIHRNPFIF